MRRNIAADRRNYWSGNGLVGMLRTLVAPLTEAKARTLKFAALHNPAYRKYFAFNLMSMTADNIEHVISYWVMFQSFHSPALAGFAVISHWVPFLLFSLHAGALADRHDCRKLIQISQALFMIASLAWGVLFSWAPSNVVAGSFSSTAPQAWSGARLAVDHPRHGGERRPAQRDSPERQQPLPVDPAGPAVGGGLMLLSSSAGILTNV